MPNKQERFRIVLQNMDPLIEKPLRYPATYCCPHIVAIGPQVIGSFVGALRADRLRYTPSYFEIALLVGLITDSDYTMHL